MSGTFVSFPVNEETRGVLDFFLEDALDLPPLKHGYHVTTVYSKGKPIEYKRVAARIPGGQIQGYMLLQGNNDLGLTLCFAVDGIAIRESHACAMSAGAVWDYPTFRPHLALAYGIELSDLTEKILYIPVGINLVFDEEQVLELDENWKPIR